MKKQLLLLILLFSFSFINSQNCNSVFTDSGGEIGNYSNSENTTITFCPENSGDVVTLQFISFNTESGWDGMMIYNGPDTNSPIIDSGSTFNRPACPSGAWTGNTEFAPNIITATNASGCLTVVFTSDGSVIHSGWVANVLCGSPPTCFPPTDLAVTNITSESAEFSWTDTNTQVPANGWDIVIVPQGDDPATGTPVNVNTNPYIATGLNPSTAYDFYIAAVCDDQGNPDPSFMSGPLYFQTLVTPLVCGDVFLDSGGTASNYQNNENITYTICPDNSGDVVTLQFTSFNTQSGYDGMMIYNGPDTNSPLIDSGSTFNRTTCPNGAWTGNAEFAPNIITATNASGCLTVVFTSDGYANSEGWVANVLCGPPPSCYDVENLNVDSVTTDSITISWTDNLNDPAPNTEYTIEYGPTGFTQGTGTILTNQSNPATITGLNAQTQYDFYVQANCDVNDDSYWKGPISATTNENPPIDYPYVVEHLPYKYFEDNNISNIFSSYDDIFSDYIYLDYNFNYFGYYYNRFVVGSNGIISFQQNIATNEYCSWVLSSSDFIPSPNLHTNAILGPFHDMEALPGSDAISGVSQIGTFPFRRTVTTFDNFHLYNCTDIYVSSEVILYETYNFIDVQIKDRIPCMTWNNGNAALGIQSIGGVYGYAPADRNTGTWEAHNEAWRFRPTQDFPDFQYIVCDANNDNTETFDLATIINHFNTGSGNFSFTLFETLADAENNVNAITTSTYTNTSNTQTIFLREYDNANATVYIKKILLAVIDCTADYDLDTVDTVTEDLNGNGNYGDDDTDGDQIPDFLDEDDDGDYVLTEIEAVFTNRTSRTNNYLDTDGDQIPNYLDNNDDGDALLTLEEDVNGNYNPQDDDTDGDNIPDYLDNEALSTTNNLLQQFVFYPNPAKDILTVEFSSNASNTSIEIFTLQGKKIIHKRIENNIQNIDISKLSNGIYFIKATNNNESSIKKFVKE